MDFVIRDATVDDLDAINAVYNECVLNTTATFHERPVSRDQRLTWWRELEGRFPVLVAESEGKVIGWASLGEYSSRCAYRFTLESSVYLSPVVRGRRLGLTIMTELLGRIPTGEYHSVLAIAAVESEASLRLHRRLGFHEVGRMKEVGFKFGRWIDVVIMQRML